MAGLVVSGPAGWTVDWLRTAGSGTMGGAAFQLTVHGAAGGQAVHWGKAAHMYYGEKFNAWTHLVGAILAVAGTAVLLIL